MFTFLRLHPVKANPLKKVGKSSLTEDEENTSGQCIYPLRVLCKYYTITAPQDAHKLVLEVAEWLIVSLPGLARHELTF